MEETRYRMHLYQYKQKIQPCEILMAQTGFIHALKTIPPSLASSVGPTDSLPQALLARDLSRVLERWASPKQPKGMLLGQMHCSSPANNSAIFPNILQHQRVYLSDGFC